LAFFQGKIPLRIALRTAKHLPNFYLHPAITRLCDFVIGGYQRLALSTSGDGYALGRDARSNETRSDCLGSFTR